MKSFKYQPYYSFQGPTLSQPFRDELAPDQIERNLRFFFDEVGNFFGDLEVKIEAVGDGIVEIQANITQDDCDERVKRCLNSLDLFARKIRDN